MVDIKTNRFYLAEKAKFEKQKQAKNYVIDPKTNLMWQDDRDTNSIKRNFKGAQKYCDELEMGGYNDWRLPNAGELYSLVDETKKNNTNSIIKYSSLGSYVSSTFFDEEDHTLWFINFKNPHFRGIKGGMEAKFSVRCVRGKELTLDRKEFYIYWKRIINGKK
ncbi:hypothetical protein CRV02_13430 [Arcobacter sp. CECT 8989]|uniref:Lcl C-terminal domain-containing protein n=1 Tax=Arcobacter sp. CECT 8989 TaxID=2044509 RepID=UPI00100B5B6A|nr:DUF1566 domain-containing protein [Arcobacter sp. CECT 8989]RXJ98489.1 hypothetical protein CRV02_13430 [Arcobacter sp. CECT 8989]